MAVNTYYFDASDGGPTDPNSVWTDDAKAFNGNTTDYATTQTVGTSSVNYLMAEGTNATPLTEVIQNVRARVYGESTGATAVNAFIYTDSLAEFLGEAFTSGSAGYGSYVTLAVPSGGWTWAKVQALETRIIKVGQGPPTVGNIYKVEIEVTSGPYIEGISTIQGIQSIQL